MRRTLTAIVGAAALAAVTVAPANAQEIPDVPPLGFQVNPTQGPVGSTVNGQVNTDDVAANCITDPDEFVAQFTAGSSYADAVTALIGTIPNYPNDAANDPEQFSLRIAELFPAGLVADLQGTGELVDAAVDQTFIMAFVDIATTSPIEPRGNFDPDTGAGQVTVPNVAPGNYPVISTCVALPAEITQEQLTAAIDEAVAFVEANFTPPFPGLSDLAAFTAAAQQVVPVILEALVEPQALGIQFFCVTDATGACPGAQPPPAPPATPVAGRPNFTG